MSAPKSRGRAGESATAAFGATLASAAAYGLAFGPVGWHGLAWGTLAPFFVALRGASVARSIALGATWGVVAAYSVGIWMPVAVTRYYAQPLWVGIVGFLLCALVTVVPYTVLFALLHRRSAGRLGALAPFVTAATWSASELARALSPAGNPWALVGYTQVPVLPVVQIAELTGVFGVGFLVAAVNAALAGIWWTRRGLAPERTRARLGAAAAAVLVAAAWAYGAARLEDAAGDPGAPVTVVQGDLDLGSQWRSEFYGENLEAYLRATDAALARRPARLVVWPENALTFFLPEEDAYRSVIANVLAAHDAELLTGGPLTAPSGEREPRYRNAAFLVEPDGEVRAVYEKEFLVPFAEYFPLPLQGALRRRFGRVREFSVGTRHEPLPTAVGAAGVLVCNEALYGDVARDRVRSGAELLVNLSNDGWVGEPQYAAIVFEMSRLRAVETRRWLVRSSTSGPSAVIDPFGRIAADAPADRPAVLEGWVAPRSDATPYVRFGDAFGWACAALAVAAAVRRA